MGVVFISSSAARSPLGLSSDYLLTQRSSLKKPSIVAFKADDSTNSPLIIPRVLDKHKEKRVVATRRKPCKATKTTTKSPLDQNVAPSCPLDYNEAAARLESIYKLSPPPGTTLEEEEDGTKVKVPRRRKRKESGEEKKKVVVVRNNGEKEKRLTLDKRIALKRNNVQEKPVNAREKVTKKQQEEEEKLERLVREYSASNDVVSLDWKKMKIPPVLSSAEHTWLFKLMQPMKVFF